MVQKRGGVRLRDWLKDERRNQAWLGEQIETHQTNISRWIRGQPIPLGMAVAIKRVTGIDVEDWVVEAESGSTLPDSTEKSA